MNTTEKTEIKYYLTCRCLSCDHIWQEEKEDVPFVVIPCPLCGKADQAVLHYIRMGIKK